MGQHQRFEWDEIKSRANAIKHGVEFNDAALVLADKLAQTAHVEIYDAVHSLQAGEDRWITLGSDPSDRRIVLTIVWTERAAGRDRITRIISARRAGAKERKAYAQEISRRQMDR